MPVDQIIAALKAPSKTTTGTVFSLDEIKKDFKVGSLLQAVEVKSMSFDFDSASVREGQAQNLGNLAAAMKKILSERPDEVFFVAGHADAPGTEQYNLQLSKKRAMRVKTALVDVFGIPEKSIIAAGFGEHHPKVQTELAEETNRRVTVRCITPLVKAAELKQ